MGIAAGDHDKGLVVGAQRFAHHGAALDICLVGDGTSIDDHDVGPFVQIHQVHPRGLEVTGDRAGLGKV